MWHTTRDGAMMGAMTKPPAQGDSPVATTTDPPAHAVAGEHTAECGGEKCGGPHCPPADADIHTDKCTDCAQLNGDGPPPQPVLHAVHLDLDLSGQGTVSVDGHDLSALVARGGVTIQAGDRKTRVTKVYLELMAGATYDGPAEVTVLANVPVVDFLESVNPIELSKAALARGFNTDPIASALAVLIEQAQAIAGTEPATEAPE